MDRWLKPEFDCWRTWIERQRNSEKSWVTIALGERPDMGLLPWMKAMEVWSRWPALGTDDEERAAVWGEILKQKQEWEEKRAREGALPLVVGKEGMERPLTIPEEERTSWVLYKKHLIDSDLSNASINSIESSSFRILRRLRIKTAQPDKAVKGMVVGHVQSGKTASMAGLIAMAADWQWNMVIVLTGTIENLRAQTEERLVQDLDHGGNLSLRKIDYPGPASPPGSRTQDLHLGTSSNHRYLVVTLKNKTRLENLYRWLTSNSASLAQMRIIIIDDEADQASIDTSSADAEKRKAINQSIISLTQVKAECVNYVAYTATPYANFLNEAYPESLYPQDFIVALPQSDEHFGPKQVFGIAETDTEGGLGLVNAVSPAEIEHIKTIHEQDAGKLPASLADSVCWFLCGTAAIRAYGDINKPVSMLVHTSAMQIHHERVANAIQQFLKETDPGDLLRRCEDLWKAQTKQLTKERFEEFWPGYGRRAQLRDYPSFKSMVPHIKELLDQFSHILIVDEPDGVRPKYHHGIHLCIDNCANNGLTDDNEHIRLKYPNKAELERLGFAPAFIIVGGSTLSRGLTIENLISTYFLRAGAQMDTLMQMGRWFGFRRNYELIPRLWMPSDTRAKFVYMADVESDLREDLARFMDQGADPKEYGPRVKNHPKASWLRPTAKNKMREAQPAEYDFSGVNRQTTIFHTNTDVLSKNVAEVESILSSLGNAAQSARKGIVVWRGVAFRTIARLLRSQTFHPRLGYFSDLNPFIEWFERNSDKFEEWNILVAGPETVDPNAGSKVWSVGGFQIFMIERTRLSAASDADSAAIGVLRDPAHLLADAKVPIQADANETNVSIARKRALHGLQKTPQLLLYRIDGATKAKRDSKRRVDLSLGENPVGISIWIPDGDSAENRKSYVTKLTVRIPPELAADGDDAVDAPRVRV